MNTLTFLNQPLLWGLLLAAAPIIIHLLYRRRFRRVEWAPMHYLKLSIQRNRRRMRLEQLLLLLLRTAAVLLLFFLVARPVMHAQGLASWLGVQGRTSRLIVIDDSLSMGYRDGGQTAADHARQLAAEMIGQLGEKDRLTVVAASRVSEPLLRDVELRDRAALIQVVQRLQVSDAYVSWDAVLAGVDELMATSTLPVKEVTLLTDLRHSGWDASASRLGDRWAGEQVSLRILDVGSPRSENVALLDLQPIDRLALAGAAQSWQAVIRNNTATTVAGMQAQWSVDGKSNVVQLPEIEAGQTAQVPLSATFQDAGFHQLEFTLHHDALAADDVRRAAIRVRKQLRIQLVDGEPSVDVRGGEVDFLALALSIGVGDADAWQVEVLSDAEWSAAPLADLDLLVLANVASLNPDRARQLADRVRSGLGLMIFAGGQLDPDNYNQALYRDGQGPLPVPLENILDLDASGLLVEDLPETPLSALRQLAPAVLERVRVARAYGVRSEIAPDSGVRVLARWNTPEATPAVIEKRLGSGRALLWTVTADRAWSDWPTAPSYVLAVREAARAIARSDELARSVAAGSQVQRTVDGLVEVTRPVVEVPGIESPQPLAVASFTRPDGSTAERIELADTHRAGLYRLSWIESPGGVHEELLAVNADARESDLARIEYDEVSQLLGRLDPQIVPALAGSDAPVSLSGQEIWKTLAGCLLGLLLLDSCFAAWVGRRR